MFDYGATHSFISTKLVSSLGPESQPLIPELIVKMPKIHRNCMINVVGYQISFGLVIMDMVHTISLSR